MPNGMLVIGDVPLFFKFFNELTKVGGKHASLLQGGMDAPVFVYVPRIDIGIDMYAVIVTDILLRYIRI